MIGLFERLFGRSNQPKTGKLAKDRLQFVLVQDRIDLPNDQMQEMQREIIEVISKYVMVDMDNVDFELSNRDRSGLLIAEIPFKAAKKDNNKLSPTDDDNIQDNADNIEDTVKISVQRSEDMNDTAEAFDSTDDEDELTEKITAIVETEGNAEPDVEETKDDDEADADTSTEDSDTTEPRKT